MPFSNSTRYRNLKTVGFEPLQAAAGWFHLSSWDQKWSVWRRRGTHRWWDTNPYKELGQRERSGWFPGDFFWSYLLDGNPGQLEFLNLQQELSLAQSEGRVKSSQILTSHRFLLSLLMGVLLKSVSCFWCWPPWGAPQLTALQNRAGPCSSVCASPKSSVCPISPHFP